MLASLLFIFASNKELLQSSQFSSYTKKPATSYSPKKRIETSLYSEWDKIHLLIDDDIDEWIVDVKDLNLEIYKEYTGMDNSVVIANLKKLIEILPKEKVRIRVPSIPDYNSTNDIEHSIGILQSMGYSRIEQFEYVT